MKLIRLVENRNRNPNRIAERELSGASNFSGALEQGCDVDDAPHKRRDCFRLREIYLNVYTSIPYYITCFLCIYVFVYSTSVSLLILFKLLSGRCRLVCFNIN